MDRIVSFLSVVICVVVLFVFWCACLWLPWYGKLAVIGLAGVLGWLVNKFIDKL
jgi:hypothetical protein